MIRKATPEPAAPIVGLHNFRIHNIEGHTQLLKKRFEAFKVCWMCEQLGAEFEAHSTQQKFPTNEVSWAKALEGFLARSVHKNMPKWRFGLHKDICFLLEGGNQFCDVTLFNFALQRLVVAVSCRDGFGH